MMESKEINATFKEGNYMLEKLRENMERIDNPVGFVNVIEDNEFTKIYAWCKTINKVI